MNRELPNFQEWLIAQCGREDDVGFLSRLWLEVCQDAKSFQMWLESCRLNSDSSAICKTVESEYSEALEHLKIGEYCDSYQYGLTIPGMRRMTSKSAEFHKNRPGVSPHEYLHFLREKLFTETIKGRRIVYLDTNYWIGMRHVYLGDSKATPEFRECLRVLTALVDKGDIICPLSLPIFFELLKQTDPRTRVATAELITTLSEGVALRSINELVELEVRKVTARRLGGEFPAYQIWTRNVFVARVQD